MKWSNRKKRLERRIQGFNDMLKSGQHEGKVDQRLRSGGYKKPGSMKKAG